jgi:general secretion pathway protein K
MNFPGLSKYQLSSERGSVLIISLWVLFFLTFFTVVLGKVIMQKLNVTARIDNGIKTYFAACAGIETAKAVLNQEKPKDPKAVYYNWASDERVFKDVKVGEAVYNISYQIKTGVLDKTGPVSYVVTYGAGESEFRTIFGLIDEERKLNINKAPKETLENFFNQMNIEEAKNLASSIIDWRDLDYETDKGGAENAYYNNLENPYSARNGPFKSIYELLLVKGMSKNSFDIIKDYITVFGDGKVNLNTAQKEVLTALGLTPPLIIKINEYRNGPDGKQFTSDDREFSDTESIIPILDSFKGLTDDEKKELEAAIAGNLIGVKAQSFQVRTTGNVSGRRTGSYPVSYEATYGAYIDCVISKEGDVLFWNER